LNFSKTNIDLGLTKETSHLNTWAVRKVSERWK
jgi:hypothetical protein